MNKPDKFKDMVYDASIQKWRPRTKADDIYTEDVKKAAFPELHQPDKLDDLDEILDNYAIAYHQLVMISSVYTGEIKDRKRAQAKAEIEKHYIPKEAVRRAIGEDELPTHTLLKHQENLKQNRLGRNRLRAEIRERLGLDK